tara:strand:- start:387 stop:533 length:147 start_codon:yes stop_codon:yes gene_type:complete
MYNNVLVKKSPPNKKLKPDKKVVLPFRMPKAKPLKFNFTLKNTFEDLF